MGFRINTNVAALNAHTSSVMNNRNLDNSLARLSSGLRINKAADDASGLAIANSLRAQASSLGQAVSNGNDAIGLIQTADGALSEYSNILDTIKTKSIQAASDGQNTNSRLAIQKDIDKLMEELNIIAKTTSFNGQKLLSGTFQNKEFQMGANANESIKVSIASAETSQIGQTSRADLNLASEQGGEVSLTMKSATTGKELTLKTIDIQYNNDTQNGMGALADEINRYSGDTGISAKAIVESSADQAVSAGSTGSDFAINGIAIGAINVAVNDNDGTLVNAINSKTTQTGVTASMSTDGKLTLSSDGRAIKVEGDVSSVIGATASQMSTIGKIELVQAGSAEFQISGIGAGAVGGDISIGEMTTVQDSTLAAGSIIASGSEIAAGSTVGGDIKILETVKSTQLDSVIKAGSTLNGGSVLSKGSTLGGRLSVGGTTTTTGSIALEQDMLLTAGSTIKGGSTLGKGTIITTSFTDNGVTYEKGDVLSANLTLQAGTDITLTADMTLKDNGSDANSAIALGSSINTGSILGADFTTGTLYNIDSSSTGNILASTSSGSPTTEDLLTLTDIYINTLDNGDNIFFAEGTVLKAGTILRNRTNLDGATAWSGTDLVTNNGTFQSGDTLTINTDFTLLQDATVGVGGVNLELDLNAGKITEGSILKAGFWIQQANLPTVVTGSSSSEPDLASLSNGTLTLENDMILKAGSNISANSTLLSGTSVGDSVKVYGTGPSNSISLYSSSDIKAGSTLASGTILAEGSTIGGKITLANNETLTSDMTLKAGSTLKFDDSDNAGGTTATYFKAGTVMTQDMVLNTANDGAQATEVLVSAGDVLTSDLYLDGLAGSDDGANVTLSEDMLVKAKSIIEANSELAVNTENAGTVGLSNEEFTNLSDIDVTTLEGAMKAIDTLSAAITNLDTIRSDLGSVQNQVVSTINNISVTQVNVKAAESNIRDADFAAESAHFAKYNILAQSGSYAMSQANAVQQNIMRLLQ